MIVDSSIWEEPDFVCKIFVTMLALKDSDDVCRFNAYQLARRSHKTEKEVLEALQILSSPDHRRLEPQPNDGRRIMSVPDGWLILNGEKYREMVEAEMRKARWRRAQAKKRAKEKIARESKQQSSLAGINSMPHPPLGYDSNPPPEPDPNPLQENDGLPDQFNETSPPYGEQPPEAAA